MKNKYRGGRPKGVKNGESSNPSKGKLWETEEEKAECWKRAEEKIDQLPHGDGYGKEQLSRIKNRTNSNSNKARYFTYYKGAHDELWGNDLSGDELINIAYGEEK